MHRQGSIVRFDSVRGFGFLRCDETAADVFFHVRDFDRRMGEPAVGQQVDFEEIHVGGKGPRAMAVRPTGQARASATRPARPDVGKSLRPATAPTATPKAAAATRPVAGRGGAPQRSAPASLAGFAAASLAELALLGWCLAQQRLAPVLLLGWLLLNLATFWLYWHDKHAAGQRRWRVREDTLHGLALVGGWPAAWWAQQVLRHKSRKPAFRQAYWASVLGHLAMLAAWASLPVWLPG